MLLKLFNKEILNISFILIFMIGIWIDAYRGTIFTTTFSCIITTLSVIMIIVDLHLIYKSYKEIKSEIK